ncbi:MAG: DUF5086 family protein [Methylovulum sp.]|nr:DUF5086 family protein [Methylovulum sp.]
MIKITVMLLFVLMAQPVSSAGVDLQQHKPGIWSFSATKKLHRWVIIHNLEEAKTTGIYHIEVIARGLHDPAWQIQHLARHIAITETALAASVLKPLTKGAVYPESFDGAYRAWQRENQGQGGTVCRQTVLACLAP